MMSRNRLVSVEWPTELSEPTCVLGHLQSLVADVTRDSDNMSDAVHNARLVYHSVSVHHITWTTLAMPDW